MKDLPEIVTAFRTSSYSQSGTQECVEVAQTDDNGRAIRDSKDPSSPTLYFTPAAWSAFANGVAKA